MTPRPVLFVCMVLALISCGVSGAFAAYWQATDLALAGSPAYASLSTVVGKTDQVWAARSGGGLDLITRSRPTDPWVAQSCAISGSPVYKCVVDDTRDSGQTMRCFLARSTGGIDLVTWNGSEWVANSLNLAGSPIYSWISVVRGRTDWLWAAKTTGGIELVSSTSGVWTAASLNLAGSPVYSSVSDNTSVDGLTLGCFASKPGGGVDMIASMSGTWQSSSLPVPTATRVYRSVNYVHGRSNWIWAARTGGDMDLVNRLYFSYDGSTEWAQRQCGIVYGSSYVAIADDTTNDGQLMRCFAAKSSGGVHVIQFFDGAWKGNQLGKDDIVLSPFTPIVVSGQSVSMWGRTYRWNNSLFPVQITSAEKDILAAPIEIYTTAPSGLANQANVTVTQSTPTRAVVECLGYIGGVPVKATHLVEYDGLCYTTLEITPIGSASLPGLKLYIPYKAQEASLYHWFPKMGGVLETTTTRGEPLNGYLDMAYTPTLWLGNEDRGATWFAESQRGWKMSGNTTPINITANTQRTALTVKFYNTSLTLSSKLTLKFGLMATPVKQLPSDWRFRRAGRDWSYTWCQAFTGSNNYITHVLPTWSTYVTNAHQTVPIYVPYQRPDWINTKEPEASYYANTWATGPYSNAGTDDGSDNRHLEVCLATEWEDFMVYYAVKAVDTYRHDGYYFDGGTILGPCNNIEHGHGWVDENGTTQPTWPLLAFRDYYKRLATEFQKRGEPYMIWCHDYFNLQLPCLSFVDQVWDGEQFWNRVNPSRNYGNEMTYDWFRSEYLGQQFGIIVQWLGEFRSWDGYPDPTPSDFNTMLMFSLPHGVGDLMMASYWTGDANGVYLLSVLGAQEAFGIRDSDCSFLGYWENSEYLNLSPVDKKLVCSVWKKPDKALLILGNISTTDQQAVVTLNLGKLGFQGVALAKDKMTGQVQVVNGNIVNTTVLQSNWRMIEVQAALPVSEAKKRAMDSSVGCAGTVTAAYADGFYIESSDKVSGIKVKKTGYSVTVGQTLLISGVIRIDPTNQERYIDAEYVTPQN